MPRLTNSHYLELHHMLRSVWLERQIAFGYLKPNEHWDLHRYFLPYKEISNEALLMHRKTVSASDPSLPQRAGRALKHFVHAIQMASQIPPTAQASPRVRAKPRRNVKFHIWPIVCPEPDYRKIARVLVGAITAEEMRSSFDRKVNNSGCHERVFDA